MARAPGAELGRASRWPAVLGTALVLSCFTILGRSLAEGWHEVRPALVDVTLGWVGVALVLSVLAMAGLALLWWACLRAFGRDQSRLEVACWYFAGELGKYLPGGIWTVVGRGEIARRHAVPRAVAYWTVAMSLLTAFVAGVALVAALLVIGATDLGAVRWAAAPAAAACLVLLHPRPMGIASGALRRISAGRLDLPALPWRRTLSLVGFAVPAWSAVGLASVALAKSLHFDGAPSRIALASVAAWLAGLAAVPVPAGAGVRELVFVALSGLPAGPAVLLATTGRLLYLVVDAAGGALALRHLRAHQPSRGKISSGSAPKART